MRHAPAEYFPMYKSGDVYIKSELVTPPKHWQLHSHILGPLSSWFARAFRTTSIAEKPSSWFSFTIKEFDGKAQLVQDQATGERPIIEVHDGGIIGGMSIKVETEDETKDDFHDPEKERMCPFPRKTVTPDTTSETDSTDMTSIYNQIFGTFYNIPPLTFKTSIKSTLTHAEALTAIATTLDYRLSTPHILTSTINNTLSQYRQSLFYAIKKDPVRWLLLSMSLQNSSIYTESLIHICVAHPCWPWPTPRSVLPPPPKSCASSSRSPKNWTSSA
jgi:hypothetical protein